MWITIFRFLILVTTLASAFMWRYSKDKKQKQLSQIVLYLFGVYAIVNILLVMYFWINHNVVVDCYAGTEGSSLEQVRRAMVGQAIYIMPSSDFIPFAYQPLYYYLAAFFARIFGLSCTIARVVSIIATIGSFVVIFLTVSKRTNSSWWGLMASGLFAGAYSVLDNTLEGNHPDAWLLFTVLLGCYLIDEKKSKSRNIVGVLLTVLAFWFKQHGAIFAFGALVYLSWGKDWKNVWFYWALVFVLGPVLYFSVPASIFGPYYHFYTWDIPRRWTEFNFNTVRHFGGFIIKSYPLLSILSLGMFIYRFFKWRIAENVWYFMFPFAVASGVLGALDPGSSNNVFILMGVWFIIVGTLSLEELVNRSTRFNRFGFHWIVFGVTFAAFFYNPFSIIVSTNYEIAYRDFVNYVDSLDGPVYAPGIGQLPDANNFYPFVNWVALEDIIRGPGVHEQNHPVVREILEPVLHPKGNAYILMNYPLENDPMLGFLMDYYVLDQDLGERFSSLGPINPARWNLMWPRYLYKYRFHN